MPLSPPGSSPDSDLLDLETAEAVFGGAASERERRMLGEMLRDLCADLPGEFDALDAAWAAGDGAAGRRLCHRLRGIVANFGLAGAARLLAEGEMLAPGAAMSAANRAEVRRRFAAGVGLLRARYAFLRAVPLTPPGAPAGG